MEKQCLQCKKLIKKPYNESMKNWLNRHKFCSHSCSWKYHQFGSQTRIKKGQRLSPITEFTSETQRGNKLSEESKRKIREAHKISGHRPSKMFGAQNPQWIEDRSKLKTAHVHSYDSKYKYWMLSVKRRDGWKCKISNGDCAGQVVAHHILSWKEYPNLRYEVNNGITLCHFHHPHKRNDEMRLSPYFQNLVMSEVH